MLLCTLIGVSIYVGAIIALASSIIATIFSIILFFAGLAVRKKTTHPTAGLVMMIIAGIILVIAIAVICLAASFIW